MIQSICKHNYESISLDNQLHVIIFFLKIRSSENTLEMRIGKYF